MLIRSIARGLIGLCLAVATACGDGASDATSPNSLGNEALGNGSCDNSAEPTCSAVVLNGGQATQCIFTVSDFFTPDASLVGDDMLVTVQAIGQPGQASGDGKATGGQGGEAQTTLPASLLGEGPYYVYVAQDFYTNIATWTGGGGGAASVVSSAEFWLDESSGSVPDEVIVIAGGGGGGGTGTSVASGGYAGVAISAGDAENVGGEDGGTKTANLGGGGATYKNGVWTGGEAFDLTATSAQAGSDLLGMEGGAFVGNIAGDASMTFVCAGTTPALDRDEGGYGGFGGTTTDLDADEGGGGGGGAGAAGGGGGTYSTTESGTGGGGGGSFARDSDSATVPDFAQSWLATSDDSVPTVVLTFYQDPSAT